ncbi:hypothetical protein [uncultured Variovorax sp.]|uniref:hypothetical protein n=1 Tax=uncultured Variovorax sp. TaxID=114708 RepID=UPI00262E42EF|nr:hypothetical protein [uncultured Variovorax sp.]
MNETKNELEIEMTGTTDDIRTSALVQEDIQQLKDNLWQEPELSGAPRWQRAVAILDALLPMVVFLEDSGRAVAPADLLDLNRLEKLMFDSSRALGTAFAGPSQWIEERLKELPGYVLALRGMPTPGSQEMYTMTMVHARTLGAAAAGARRGAQAAISSTGPEATECAEDASGQLTDIELSELQGMLSGLPTNSHRSHLYSRILQHREAIAGLGVSALPKDRSNAFDVAAPRDVGQSAAVAAIEFSLQTTEGPEFLRAWQHGDWDTIRREWPEAPGSVFVAAGPDPSPGLVYTDRLARDKVATALDLPITGSHSYAWEYLLAIVEDLAAKSPSEGMTPGKHLTMQLSETSCNDLRTALGTSEEPSNIVLYIGPSEDEDKEKSFGLHAWDQEYPDEGMALIHSLPAATSRKAVEERWAVLERIERAVTVYGDARAGSAMNTATLKAELMCEIELGIEPRAEGDEALGEKEGASGVPDRKGVYAWVTSTGHAALALVSKRPTEHCAGGTLNAVVMESIKFYDGCAVDQWGKDGRWVMLHAFPEIPMAAGAVHD